LYEVLLSQTWALYNALKFWTLYNLSEQEVRLLLLTFSDNELKLTKICKSGDSKWESALSSENVDFIKPENKAPYLNSEGFPSLEMRSDSVTDTGFFQVKSGKVQHPRLHNRYEKSVECTISNAHNKVFNTQTIDISEGGLYFKHIIPDWIAGYFIVVVNDQFQLLCSIVEDQKEKNRVQIVAEDNDPQYELYKEWLRTL
jgi:hypothetical protein